MSKKPVRIGVSVLLAALALVGCRVEQFDYVEELDTIGTVYEPERDYSGLMTYAMPDEIFDLSEFVDEPRERDDSFDPLILEQVATQMARYGWVRLDDPEDPAVDVVLAVGAVATDNWVLYGYYPWYGGWWWYYPPAVVPVNYPTGSIVITMGKPDEVETGEDGEAIIPVIWTAGLRGLSADTASNIASRIETSITQAFDQSPYLRVGEPQPTDQ